MKQVVTKLLLSAFTGASTITPLGACRASSGSLGLLPWDGPLTTVAAYLIDVAAPALVKLAFAGTIVVFAVGGNCELTRWFARAALGVSLALMAVRLLNYLLPY
jgi:hypothetical protein